MEISLSYGVRRYFISDNWFYFLLFLVSVCVFLKQKQKEKNKKKIKPSIHTRGGGNDNSVVLQKLYDQCLSDDFYVEVTDSKVKQIIRRMLDIEPGKTIIISAPVYLLAILKQKYAPLVLQKGGTRLIISNFRGFVSKGFGTVLFAKLVALGSGSIIAASIPLILAALLYSELHIDCNSFVSPLPNIDGNFQYIERVVNEDSRIIVSPYISPQTPKTLYHAFDETEVSSISSLSCYIKNNCLGPEPIQLKSKKVNSKPKRFIPLSQRTKTLKDLECHVDEMDEIDVHNVNYRSNQEKN